MSVYDLKNLIVLEEYLLGVLDRFRQELQYKVITIENYLEMTKKRNNSLEINKFAFNFEESVPIVRRLYFDYSRLVAFLDNNSWDVCIKAIYDQEPKLPTKKDLIETTNGLYIMQSVYSMKISKMAKGIFQGVDYNSSLNAFECFTMAMFLEELDELIYAKQWLEVSLDFYMKDTVNRDLYAELGFSSIMIYELYASVLHRLGNGRDNLTVNDTLRSLNPEGFGIEKDQIQEPDMILEKENWEAYTTFCSTENRPSKSNLYCFYKRNTSHFLYLAPLKLEILSLNPYMVFYHDVISDNDIFLIKVEGQKNLTRARTFNLKSNNREEDSGRTTKVGWLDNNSLAIVQKMNKLVEDMTNLDLSSSAVYEVLNYGIGGFYGAHVDYYYDDFQKNDEFLDDRKATIVFYLSDVTQGGATAFPALNISVFPKKRSALMWYNLDNKGNGIPNSIHTACSTAVGSKWVMIKWLTQAAQMFRKPCLKEV
nr:prolyl 4-hydroxylase subunit alpha-1 [Drosophila bipectinata]